MKKMFLLVMAGIALFSFIFATSILWYKFFYGSSSVENENINSIRVELSDVGNTLDTNGLIPLDDETASNNINPYEFNVINDSLNDTTYNILLEDSIISDDANYTNKELLSRKQLKYQLSLNNQVIKVGYLADIKNNILDTRVIYGSQTNNYKLIIYVSEEAQNTEWQNKYYHFNINVSTEENL